MFHYHSIEEIYDLLANNSEFTIITIDNRDIGKRCLIDHIERAINSPYERDDWDGFAEAIRSLYWLEDPHIRIVHTELPILSEKELAYYIEILHDAYNFWAMTPPLDVDIIFADVLREVVEQILSSNSRRLLCH
jgi:hypothetical protein